MARHKWLTAAIGVVLVGLSMPASMQAVENSNGLEKKVAYVTFTRPVTLPGVALGSGTYVFELVDPMGARNIVRVSSPDRRVVFLTTFTRIVERPQDVHPGQPFSFGEARADASKPISTWWPAGESTGRQFIY